MTSGEVVELDPKQDLGVMRELQQMEKLALIGSKDPFVLKNAMRIVIDAGIPRKAYLQEVETLLRYAQSELRYTRSPKESIATPRVVEEHGGGDAADLAVWLAAHLLSIGNGPVRFVVISDPRHPDQFSHVYLHYGNPETDRIRWFALDPTVDKPMDWESSHFGKKAYYDVGAEEEEEGEE